MFPQGLQPPPHNRETIASLRGLLLDKIRVTRVGLKMAQRLGVLVALLEDLDLLPRTYKVVHNHL